MNLRRTLLAGLLAVIAATAAVVYHTLASSPASVALPPKPVTSDALPIVVRPVHRPSARAGTERPAHRRVALPGSVWPAAGQAAVTLTGDPRIHAGPNQHSAPIASVAKVMTAYLVLRHHPLPAGEEGPTITLTAADVADTDRRAAQHQSVVPVSAGEQLTERQALEALLLPSANNIAAVLARWTAGSEGAFVVRMNAAARSLGMTNTRYTDPSGFDDSTVSTAADQVRIVERAMRIAAFAHIVAMPSAVLPVAGTVHNTNTLLGDDGFVGVKTGSDYAAGGCFAFRAIRTIDGKRTVITGVVLGQPGSDQIGAGLDAGAAMVDRIAGRRTTPDPGQSTAPPLLPTST